MKIHVRVSTQEDVDYLSTNLREADRLEVLASHGNVKDALQYCLDNSDECFTIVVADTNEVAGIYGLCEVDDMVAIPWLLTSPAIHKVWLPFLRQSKQWVAQWNKRYPVLTNACDERYTVALKWLKFVGFTFIKRHETYGEGDKPFIEFVRIQ